MLGSLLLAIAFATQAPPPVVATPYVTTSGECIGFAFSAVADHSTVRATGMPGLPILAVNGQAVGPLHDPWTTGYHTEALAAVPAGLIIKPTDVVTLSAPAGWAVAPIGIAGPLDGQPIANFAGKDDSRKDRTKPKLRPGWNNAHKGQIQNGVYNIPKNWVYRTGKWDNVFEADATGQPTKTWGGVSGSLFYWQGPYSTLDQTLCPPPLGMWAVGWDDLDTAHPTWFALQTTTPKTITVTEHPEYNNPGVNGIGQVRVFDVQFVPPAIPAATDLVSLRIGMGCPSNAPRFANLVIHGPGDFTPATPTALDRSDRLAISQTYLDRLKYGAGCMRWVDTCWDWGGMTQITEPQHALKATDFTWGRGATDISPTWSTVRPWDKTRPFLSPLFPGGQLDPSKFTEGLFYELVSDKPHGLETGQVFTGLGNWPMMTATDGTTLTHRSISPCLHCVTSPTTVVVVTNSRSKPPATITQSYALDATCRTPFLAPCVPAIPIEFAARVTGKVDGCNIHVNVPHAASDALVDYIATQVRDNFPAGRKVYVEYSNEPWNYYFTQFNMFMHMSRWFYGNDWQWQILRSTQVWQRFRAVFGDRSPEIVGLTNSMKFDSAGMAAKLEFAHSLGVPVGACAIAVYTFMDRGPATEAAYWAYDDAQAIDLYRHDLRSNTKGYPAWLTSMNGVINAYNTKYGEHVRPYAYEGGIQCAAPIPAVVSTRPDYLARSHDLIYNPGWIWAERELYWLCEEHDFAELNQYGLAIGASDLNSMYGAYRHPSQQAGYGDGSDGKADNRLTLARPGQPHTKAPTINQDFANVSVRGQAFLDRMKAAKASAQVDAIQAAIDKIRQQVQTLKAQLDAIDAQAKGLQTLPAH